MDISSGFNVNMYGTNTAMNYNIENENKIYGSNIFSSEFAVKETKKNNALQNKKKRKNKRLNTVDTDFLPDEIIDDDVNQTVSNSSNFFIEKKKIFDFDRAKKSFEYFFTSTPLINYFYLKHKEQKIKMTISELNNIMQNADELLNSSVPYGENNKVYNKIAKNLTKAANLVGRANKEL